MLRATLCFLIIAFSMLTIVACVLSGTAGDSVAEGEPAGSSALSAEDIEAVEASVLDAAARYVELTNALDLEAMLEYFPDDPRFHWVEEGTIVYSSREDVERSFESVYEVVDDLHMSADEVRVVVLSKRHAVLTATFLQEMTFSGTEVNLNGALTILMERDGDQWRFLAGHASTLRNRQE